jgi:hypothetical protein
MCVKTFVVINDVGDWYLNLGVPAAFLATDFTDDADLLCKTFMVIK